MLNGKFIRFLRANADLGCLWLILPGSSEALVGHGEVSCLTADHLLRNELGLEICMPFKIRVRVLGLYGVALLSLWSVGLDLSVCCFNLGRLLWLDHGKP